MIDDAVLAATEVLALTETILCLGAIVFDLDLSLADRVVDCLGTVSGRLAKTDFLNDARVFRDDSFFMVLFGRNRPILEGPVGVGQRTVDRLTVNRDVFVSK